MKAMCHFHDDQQNVTFLRISADDTNCVVDFYSAHGREILFSGDVANGAALFLERGQIYLDDRALAQVLALLPQIPADDDDDVQGDNEVAEDDDVEDDIEDPLMTTWETPWNGLTADESL